MIIQAHERQNVLPPGTYEYLSSLYTGKSYADTVIKIGFIGIFLALHVLNWS